MLQITTSDPDARQKAFFDLSLICVADAEKLQFDAATGEVSFSGDATPEPDGSTSPCQVVAGLASDEQTTYVITPATQAFTVQIEDPWAPGPGLVPLCSRGTAAWPTGFRTMDGVSVLDEVDIVYDVNDYTTGQGYMGYLADGSETPVASVHLLAFSVASAGQIGFQLDGQVADSSTPFHVDASLSLDMENLVRAQSGLAGRDVPLDVYLPGCPLEPGKRPGSPPPPSKPAKDFWGDVSGSKSCFVATAAYGSAFAPEVELLRRFRDDVLRRTRHGDAWFERFYGSYNEVSPAIADRMRGDPELAELLRIGIVQPYVDWLELAVAMPDAALDGVPEPWCTFLAGLQQRLDAWASAIGMPDEFAGLSGLEVARELAVILRYGFRHRSQRAAYLRRLREAGVLPLRLTAEEADAACGAMSAAGLASDQVALALSALERG
jgi:hypothetical protein